MFSLNRIANVLLLVYLVLGQNSNTDNKVSTPPTSLDFKVPKDSEPTNPFGIQFYYRVVYLDDKSATFGSNLTFIMNKINLQLLEVPFYFKFAFPVRTTLVDKFVGPFELSHFEDGQHVLFLSNDYLQSIKSNNNNKDIAAICSFVVKSEVKPLKFENTNLDSYSLLFGDDLTSSKSVPLNLDKDIFMSNKEYSVSKKPEGIFKLDVNPNQSDSDSSEIKKSSKETNRHINNPNAKLSDLDRIGLTADGTFLVGTPIGLIIYLSVFLIGCVAYISGSLLRFKFKTNFKVEKLNRSLSKTKLTGYTPGGSGGNRYSRLEA